MLTLLFFTFQTFALNCDFKVNPAHWTEKTYQCRERGQGGFEFNLRQGILRQIQPSIFGMRKHHVSPYEEATRLAVNEGRISGEFWVGRELVLVDMILHRDGDQVRAEIATWGDDSPYHKKTSPCIEVATK